MNTIDTQIETTERELTQQIAVARQAINDAREELSYIESNVRRLEDGLDYTSAGEIYGLQAAPIFKVFATAKTLRELRKINEAENDTAKCEVCGDEVQEGLRYMAGPFAGRTFCEDHDPLRGGPRAGYPELNTQDVEPEKPEGRIVFNHELTDAESEVLYNAMEQANLVYDEDWEMLYGGTSELAENLLGGMKCWALTGVVLRGYRGVEVGTKIVNDTIPPDRKMVDGELR